VRETGGQSKLRGKESSRAATKRDGGGSGVSIVNKNLREVCGKKDERLWLKGRGGGGERPQSLQRNIHTPGNQHWQAPRNGQGDACT